jgi:hypothetical protein
VGIRQRAEGTRNKRLKLKRGLLRRIWYYIATAKVIRTFLIVETLDLLSFCLLPSAFCPVPSAIPFVF